MDGCEDSQSSAGALMLGNFCRYKEDFDQYIGLVEPRLIDLLSKNLRFGFITLDSRFLRPTCEEGALETSNHSN